MAEAWALEREGIRMARGIAGPYKAAWPREAEEFDGEALLALCQAAHRYDPGRGASLETFARYRIAGAMKEVLRRLGREVNDPVEAWPDLPDPAVGDRSGADLERRELVEAMLAGLPARHAQVVRLVYLEGLSRAEAAEALGLSRTWICNLHSQALRILRHSWPQ